MKLDAALFTFGAMDDDEGYEFRGREGKDLKKEELDDGQSESSYYCGGGGEKWRDDESQDPLAVFGSGIMLMILGKLDARSVAQARLVSRKWLFIASSDHIWAPKCDDLWVGKAHIPCTSKARGIPKFSAYLLSVMDGKRTRIVQKDLCDHVWEYHFNESASDYWRNLDPYWTGEGRPMRRYFHPDGGITADPDDRVWGGHESCYTIVTGLLDDGKMREHYVRINRWLKLSVRRNEDWSWELSSSLCSYTSLPDAEKEEGTGPSSPVY